jgi:hypothetical protein
MSLLVLPRGLGWDQLPEDQVLGSSLRRMFGDGTRLEGCRQQVGLQMVHVFWLVKMDDGERVKLVPHPLEDGPASLEWWQRDHTLLGWGIAIHMGDAADRAISCARRGQLARQSLTVWRDRLRSRFLVYERSRRDPASNYRPVGRLLTRELWLELVGSLQ